MEITKLVVLGVYVAILFIIGIVASRRIKGMSDYYVGGKQMGFWAVAFSARATGESGWLLIGLTGMGAMAGYSGYWVVAGELFLGEMESLMMIQYLLVILVQKHM